MSSINEVRCRLPKDDSDEGQGDQASSLDRCFLQSHQTNHEKLEYQDRHDDLIKSLTPNLQTQIARCSRA